MIGKQRTIDGGDTTSDLKASISLVLTISSPGQSTIYTLIKKNVAAGPHFPRQVLISCKFMCL